MAKNLVLARFGPFTRNSGHQIFFFKNRDLSVTRYHGQLSSCAISEKTNDPILRKLSDGRTPKKILHGKNQRLSKKQISKYEELTFTIRIKKQFS